MRGVDNYDAKYRTVVIWKHVVAGCHATPTSLLSFKEQTLHG